MAESGSILDSLWNWVTPQSAEAKIQGTPEAMDQVHQLWSQAAQGRGQYLPDMRRRVFEAAEARPQTVQIRPDPQLLPAGNYDPQTQTIRYQPKSTAELQERDTLPHELPHFLAETSGRPTSIPVQHDLIDVLLGTADYSTPWQQRLWGKAGERYVPVRQPGNPRFDRPRALTPQEQGIIEQWLQGQAAGPPR